MILVDSSVWIDYFRGSPTSSAKQLDLLLQTEPLAIGDLILTEVLQGIGSERDFNEARKLLTSLDVVVLGGQDIAIQAAKNHRKLRALGFTVRKTIDTFDRDLVHREQLHPASQRQGFRCVRGTSRTAVRLGQIARPQ